MVNFLEGIHPRITEFLHNPPFLPLKLIPRVPATATTAEVPEYFAPKSEGEWSDEEKEIAGLASKCKRLLIMALPNEIFESLDHCETSVELWAELQRQIEGGLKTLKNNRAICINEYHDFKAKEGESLKDTYSRFNTLISKCKRFGVARSSEDNNVLFLKSLGDEWMNLTMSMRATLDLEVWSLSDLFGSLASQESQVLQMRKNIGGPLALVAEGSNGSVKGKEVKKEEKKNKKKALLVNSDESSDEDEVSMKEMMKTLALITREYRRGYGDRGRRESSVRRNDSERNDRREKQDQRLPKKTEEQKGGDKKDGCYRCGKPGHFAAECWSTGPKAPQKPVKDAAYFRKKAEYYSQKSLMAQADDLVTDESSDEEPQKGLFAAEDDSDDDMLCGMAKIESDSSDTQASEVSTSLMSESNELYKEIVDNLKSCHTEYDELKEKLFFYEREVSILTEEKDRFFKMSEKAQKDLLMVERTSKERVAKLEKELKNKVTELKKLDHEKSNAVSVKKKFQKEREFLHQDLLDRELKIRKFQDAQSVFERIRVNMGRRGLGFSEYDNKPGFKTKKTLQNTFHSSKNNKIKVSNKLATFKRRKISADSNTRTPLIMTNVSFQDYFKSFSPSEMKDSIPRKYMSQKEIGVFKFGHPETQAHCAFVCLTSFDESLLSSEASEIITQESVRGL
jgi:hypothetical protein